MTTELQIVLTAAPLACYFYLLGVFHSGKRPRMITGPVDSGLLTLGLGGLVAFGPFGRTVLSRIVAEPAGGVAWAIWILIVGLWSVLLAASASLRISVYHIQAEELDRAVADSIAQVDGHFVRTLNGFEDTKRGVGLTIKSMSWLRSGGLVAYGRAPEVLIRELKPHLRAALARLPQRASTLSHLAFGVACLTMLMPLGFFLIGNPRTQNAWRALLHSLRWW
jgi:hypothetical protein